MSRGYCVTKKSTHNTAQQELWFQIFAAQFPRGIISRNDILLNTLHPERLALQRLNSSLFDGEPLPFKLHPMTYRS